MNRNWTKRISSMSSVYSQVVIIACYSYFFAALFGSQTLDVDHAYERIDFGYFPIFLILQFIFYIGWLKVVVLFLSGIFENIFLMAWEDIRVVFTEIFLLVQSRLISGEFWGI